MKRLSIQKKIMFLTFSIIILCLSISAVFFIKNINKSIENQMANNVMNIARSVATDPVVISSFSSSSPEKVLQPYAERIRKNSKNIEFITIINMEGVRYSHPNIVNIGKRFVGGDEGRVLMGETYISKAIGTLGPSLRALTPIKDGEKQVGAVAVGTLTKDIYETQLEVMRSIFITMMISIIIGIIGAYALAKNIKKDIFGLEPHQIAEILQERSSILDAVKEGILAIDRDGIITLANNSANNILDIKGRNIIGEDVDKVIPNTRLKEVLKTGIPEFDDEQVINGISIITNRVPIIIENKVEGAIASFRDKSDLTSLGEQLTGYRQVVDTLRAQAHEFMNHMHVVSGLVNLKQYDEALNFIQGEIGVQQQFIGQVTRNIKDSKIAALLLGKYSHAAELGVKLYLEENSSLGEEHGIISTGDLVSILGNIIENAIEALSMMGKEKNKVIQVYLKERNDYVYMKVADNGPGINKNTITRIYERGFTTKSFGNGIGLYMVKLIVDKLNGDINLNTSSEKGSTFTIKIPKMR